MPDNNLNKAESSKEHFSIDTKTSTFTAKGESKVTSTGLLKIIALVFVLSLLMRLIHLGFIYDNPFAKITSGDARGYLNWAEQILAGGELAGQSFYQAPLYPYFLALIHYLSKLINGNTTKSLIESSTHIILFQALLGSCSAVLVTLTTRKLFCSRTSLMAGILWGTYAPAIFYDGIIQKASLAGFLTTLLIYLSICVTELLSTNKEVRGLSYNNRVFIHYLTPMFCGIAAGLLIITRENAIIWLAALVICFAFIILFPDKFNLYSHHSGNNNNSISQNKKSIKKFISITVMYLTGSLIVFTPVLIHNFRADSSIALTTNQSGPNFYIGNHEGASGRYEPLVPGHETPMFEKNDAARLASEKAGKVLSPGEVSSFWWDESLGYIKNNPGSWLLLTAKKCLMTINRYEVSDVESMKVHSYYSPVLKLIHHLFHFGIIFPLACLGWWLSDKKNAKIFLLSVLFISMFFAVSLFFVLGRYRYPLVPLMIPFAAYGIVNLINWIRQKNYARLTNAIVLCVVAGIIVNIPISPEKKLNAYSMMNLGIVCAQAGESEQAEEIFTKLVRDMPDMAEAHYNLGRIYWQKIKIEDAITHWEIATRLSPGLLDAQYYLAQLYESQNRWREALQRYKLVLKMNPEDVDAQKAISRISNMPGQD